MIANLRLFDPLHLGPKLRHLLRYVGSSSVHRGFLGCRGFNFDQPTQKCEQVWLVITYLQSLDRNLPRREAGEPE